MDGIASKCELRKTMKSRRREVSADMRKTYSSTLCACLLERDDVKKAMAEKGVFAVYLASVDEIDLSVLIERLWSAGCMVVVPAWRNGTYRLIACSRETKLVPGPMGILEPEAQGVGLEPVNESAVDVWIVPGLAFSRSGARMGYGGGWYDRFLAKSHLSAVSIGVAYPFQIVDSLPLESHDLPLSDVAFAL
jgi:5-formyltetrahydrofolate cyclo-ligase